MDRLLGPTDVFTAHYLQRMENASSKEVFKNSLILPFAAFRDAGVLSSKAFVGTLILIPKNILSLLGKDAFSQCLPLDVQAHRLMHALKSIAVGGGTTLTIPFTWAFPSVVVKGCHLLALNKFNDASPSKKVEGWASRTLSGINGFYENHKTGIVFSAVALGMLSTGLGYQIGLRSIPGHTPEAESNTSTEIAKLVDGRLEEIGQGLEGVRQSLTILSGLVGLGFATSVFNAVSSCRSSKPDHDCFVGSEEDDSDEDYSIDSDEDNINEITVNSSDEKELETVSLKDINFVYGNASEEMKKDLIAKYGDMQLPDKRYLLLFFSTPRSPSSENIKEWKKKYGADNFIGVVGGDPAAKAAIDNRKTLQNWHPDAYFTLGSNGKVHEEPCTYEQWQKRAANH